MGIKQKQWVSCAWLFEIRNLKIHCVVFVQKCMERINRIGTVAGMAGLVLMPPLLAGVYWPAMHSFFWSGKTGLITVAALLLSGGTFVFLKPGLIVLLTGRAKTSVIPGVLETEVPSLLARLLSLANMFIGAVAVLSGLTLILFSIF